MKEGSLYLFYLGRRFSIPIKKLLIFAVMIAGAAFAIPLQSGNLSASNLKGTSEDLHGRALESKPDFSLHFSKDPTDQELMGVALFDQRLAPIKEVKSSDENAALAVAITDYQGNTDREDVRALESFVKRYPKGRWSASILTNLGIIYRRYGYYSRALDSWEQAWSLSKKQKDIPIRLVADQAVAQLAYLLSSLGRTERLEPLLSEIHGRRMHGGSANLILNAAEGLAVMKKDPGISFKCGPYALSSLEVGLDPSKPIDKAIFTIESDKKGLSLLDLSQLAAKTRLKLQVVKRNAGAAFIVPSVVHWKSGHYAAILKQINGGYLVKDPTFRSEVVLSQKALEDESSGYFLVPAGSLPNGWSSVSDNEKKSVYGRGFSGPRTPDTTPNAKKDGFCGSSNGMVIHSVLSEMACLHLEDTPVGYTPPVGPDVHFIVAYNQYESSQSGNTFISSNFGVNWVSNWSSYVKSPARVGSTAVLVERGGGNETYDSSTYTGSATMGNYAAQVQGQAILYALPTANPARTSSPPDTNQSRFERHLPDGSVEVFDSHSDSQGNIFLTQVIDPQGNALNLYYQTVLVGSQNEYQLYKITDASGQSSTLSYGLSDDPLKITQISDAYGRKAVFTYTTTLPHQLISIQDAVGILSQFTYNPGTDAITALTTPYGTTTFNSVDVSSGNLQEPNRTLIITDPQGGQEKAFSRFEPDADAYTPVEPLPTASFIDNDEGDGDNDLEELNTYYWDKRAMLLAPNDLKQAHVDHFLTSDMQGPSPVVYSEKNALESRIWYNYQRAPGYPKPNYLGLSDKPTGTARILSNGTTQLTQSAYNALGLITQSIDPKGRTLTYDYAANNIDLLDIRQTKGTNNDILLQLTYDSTFPAHRPKSMTDAAGQTTSYLYNAQGQVTQVTNPNQEVTTYAYDANNRLISVTGATFNSAPGPITTFQYNTSGQVNYVKDSEGYVTTMTYDSLDRPLTVNYPDGTHEVKTYNQLDLATSTDRQGRITQYSYNRNRQMVSQTDPLGQVTIWNWCTCGALNSIIDANGNVTSWTRDIEGRPLTKSYPGGGTFTYTYDSAENLTQSVTDPNHQKATYGYDSDDTVTGISYTGAINSTAAISYQYDSAYKRITQVAEGTATTNYQYVPIGQLGGGKILSQTGPLTNDTLGYQYDALGRVSMQTINSVSQSFSYDSLDRLSQVSNVLGTFQNSYVRLTTRVASSTRLNGGQTTQFSYFGGVNGTVDPRLSEISNLAPDGTTVLSTFTYQYNLVGDITNWTQSQGTQPQQNANYGYDSADRLTGANLAAAVAGVPTVTSYVYDKVGNRLSEQRDQLVMQGSFNNLNQLTSLGGGGLVPIQGKVSKLSNVAVNGKAASLNTNNAPYVFNYNLPVTNGINNVTITALDGSGNASTNKYQMVIQGGAAGSYQYDANGNCLSDGLRSYQWDALNRLIQISQGSNTYGFAYDGEGHRISESDNGTLTKQWVWSNNQMVEEQDGSGNVTKRFFGQGEQIGGVAYYYTRDHLGSVREMTDGNGTVQARYAYDPYGRTTLVSGTNLSDFQYAGMYVHQTSGLYLTKYRAYDPNTARWLSRDPVGEDVGTNLYSYVLNDPVDGIDPYGLWQVTISGGAGLGGSVTFGNNNGQWNIGASLGAGAGLAGKFDPNNSDPNTPNGCSDGSAAVRAGVGGSIKGGGGPLASIGGTYFAGVSGNSSGVTYGGSLTGTVNVGIKGVLGTGAAGKLSGGYRSGNCPCKNGWYGTGTAQLPSYSLGVAAIGTSVQVGVTFAK